MFCKECGKEINDKAVVCIHCGVATGVSAAPDSNDVKSEIAYILLGVFLGSLGIHNFYAGYSKKATTQLLISVCSCGIFAIVSWIWAIVDICTIKQDFKGIKFSK